MVSLAKIPKEVLEALHNRGHSDDAIEKMHVAEMFDEYCMWHGLINWGNRLWNLAHLLDGVDR